MKTIKDKLPLTDFGVLPHYYIVEARINSEQTWVQIDFYMHPSESRTFFRYRLRKTLRDLRLYVGIRSWVYDITITGILARI